MMLLRLLSCLLAIQLAVAIDLSPVLASYADSWAVEVRGGEEVANALAKKHGFVNLGKVGVLGVVTVSPRPVESV